MQNILREVVLQWSGAGSCFTLAIPIWNLKTYYETKLLRQVVLSKFGLVFTLEIPFFSKTTLLKVHHAIENPMLDKYNAKDSVWDIETDFLAVRLQGQESALLTAHELSHFIVSTAYWFCYSGFAMEKSEDSCLSSLYFEKLLAALQSCNVKLFYLPMKDKAANVGQDNWPITSEWSNYIISETDIDPNTGAITTTHRQGCDVCIVSLPCGSEVYGPNIHIRSELEACATQPQRVLDVLILAPLNYLFPKVPPLHDLPWVASEEFAELELRENVEMELAQLPEYKRRNLEEIDKIATLIISRMATIHSQLPSWFEATVEWRTYFTCAVFFLFCLLFMLSCPIFSQSIKKIHLCFPFRLTHVSHEIKTFPVTAVTPGDYECLRSHTDHPLHRKKFLSVSQTAGKTPGPVLIHGWDSSP